MLYIKVPNRNDSISSIIIDKREYRIRFTYNEIGEYWNFGLYDREENPIIAMTKIVPNFPLTHFYTSTDLPDGVFGAITELNRIERNDFENEKANFIYIPYLEME